MSKGDDQSNALQLKALKAAGCKRVFEEAASGGRWDRPELHRMLDQLREGDVVVVWKLDRLSRSLKDLLLILDKIDNAVKQVGAEKSYDFIIDAAGGALVYALPAHDLTVDVMSRLRSGSK